MGRNRGSAATRRARTRSYVGLWRAVVAAGLATLVLAPTALAQSSGGAPGDVPTLSDPPFGVVMRPAPVLRSWRCVRDCAGPTTATAGSLVRVRGRALGRTYEVVFLGAEGEADDVATAPRLRTRRRVDVRVPLGAAAGPLLVAQHDGPQSSPSEVPLAVSAASTPRVAHAGPSIDVQVQSRRAFFDAARPAKVSYVLHADAPARALIELVRSSDETVIANWDGGDVAPETPQSLTWDGTIAERVQPQGRYSFRVSAVSADGLRAVSAHAPLSARDPAEIQFLRHEFPIRGPHYYGESAARFGGGRGHQGHDTFAACGTPLVAARGGVVKFKQYHGAAGNYIVIDGARTGIDYAYMHLRDASLVDEGERVRTGQLIGYVGQTGSASGCHLHFEMWRAPGWYDGGSPIDPLPSLQSWDKTS